MLWKVKVSLATAVRLCTLTPAVQIAVLTAGGVGGMQLQPAARADAAEAGGEKTDSKNGKPETTVPSEDSRETTPRYKAVFEGLGAKIAQGATSAAQKWQALLSFFRGLYGSLPESFRNRLERRSSANPGGGGAGTETLKASANSDSAKTDTGNGVDAADEYPATVEAEAAPTAEEVSKKKNAVEKLHVGLNAGAKRLRFEMTPFAMTGQDAVSTMKTTLTEIYKRASGVGNMKQEVHEKEYPKAMCFFKQTETGAHGVILLAKPDTQSMLAAGFPRFGGWQNKIQVGEPITDPKEIDDFFFGFKWTTYDSTLRAAQGDASKVKVLSTVKAKSVSTADDTIEIDNKGDWQQCVEEGGSGTRI